MGASGGQEEKSGQPNPTPLLQKTGVLRCTPSSPGNCKGGVRGKGSRVGSSFLWGSCGALCWAHLTCGWFLDKAHRALAWMWEALEGPPSKRRDRVWRTFLGLGGDLFCCGDSLSSPQFKKQQKNNIYIYQTRRADPESLLSPIHWEGRDPLANQRERREPAPAPPGHPQRTDRMLCIDTESGERTREAPRRREGQTQMAPPAPPGGGEEGCSFGALWSPHRSLSPYRAVEKDL